MNHKLLYILYFVIFWNFGATYIGWEIGGIKQVNSCQISSLKGLPWWEFRACASIRWRAINKLLLLLILLFLKCSWKFNLHTINGMCVARSGWMPWPSWRFHRWQPCSSKSKTPSWLENTVNNTLWTQEGIPPLPRTLAMRDGISSGWSGGSLCEIWPLEWWEAWAEASGRGGSNGFKGITISSFNALKTSSSLPGTSTSWKRPKLKLKGKWQW